MCFLCKSSTCLPFSPAMPLWHLTLFAIEGIFFFFSFWKMHFWFLQLQQLFLCITCGPDSWGLGSFLGEEICDLEHKVIIFSDEVKILWLKERWIKSQYIQLPLLLWCVQYTSVRMNWVKILAEHSLTAQNTTLTNGCSCLFHNATFFFFQNYSLTLNYDFIL